MNAEPGPSTQAAPGTRVVNRMDIECDNGECLHPAIAPTGMELTIVSGPSAGVWTVGEYDMQSGQVQLIPASAQAAPSPAPSSDEISPAESAVFQAIFESLAEVYIPDGADAAVQPDCSCHFVDIGVGMQKASEDPGCAVCTPHGYVEWLTGRLSKAPSVLAALAAREVEVRRLALREAATAVERRAGAFKNLASDKVRRQTHTDIATFLRELSRDQLRQAQLLTLPSHRCDILSGHQPHGWSPLIDGEMVWSRCDGNSLLVGSSAAPEDAS